MEGRGRDVLRAADDGRFGPVGVRAGIGDRITELNEGRGRDRRTLALITVCAVLFLTFLDTTIVSVTLGRVQSDLHAGVTSLQWVVNAYSLVFASLMLAAGTLGDRIGRKRVLVGGVALFCAGSLLSALAPTTAVLIAGRAVMGVGAAASEPGTLSVIRQLYPDPGIRARAIGAWAAVAGLALALGPVIGGLLIDAGSWRTVFWFNLVLGVVLLVASTWVLPESADPRPERFDFAGIGLGAIFLASAAFAVIEGETAGYGTAWVIALFVVSALALVGLVAVERRVPAPMLDLGELSRAVNGALFTGFAVYFGIFSIFFFTALYLDEALGYSGARIAGIFSPMAATIVLGSLLGGRWVARGGTRPAMTIGSLVAAVGIVLSALYLDAGTDVSYLPLAGCLAVAGAGFGLGMVPATAAVLTAMPAARSGIAASTINTSRQIGAVAGVAVLGALINAHLTGDLRSRLQSLGVPPTFQSLVINAIKEGSVPRGTTKDSATATYGGIVGQVYNAAYAAFRSGLTTCLIVAAAVIGLAAVIAWLTTPASGAAPSVAE
jgi:EmrB/QacA subfamily drug resistance transporter